MLGSLRNTVSTNTRHFDGPLYFKTSLAFTHNTKRRLCAAFVCVCVCVVINVFYVAVIQCLYSVLFGFMYFCDFLCSFQFQCARRTPRARSKWPYFIRAPMICCCCCFIWWMLVFVWFVCDMASNGINILDFFCVSQAVRPVCHAIAPSYTQTNRACAIHNSNILFAIPRRIRRNFFHSEKRPKALKLRKPHLFESLGTHRIGRAAMQVRDGRADKASNGCGVCVLVSI